MMRRAFTLIELMVASSISLIILLALCTALSSVWKVATRSNEELQILFQASAMRERLLAGTAKTNETGFHGLLNVTNKVAATNSKRNLTIYQADNVTADRDESLPGNNNNLVFGSASAGDKSGVVVSTLGTYTNGYDCAEIRQRTTIYLWVENKAGTVCRMPVYLTTIYDGESN